MNENSLIGAENRTASSNKFLPLILILFFSSGCAALIYEIVWFQLIQLMIGSSSISLGVLLGVYMGGMCLGSLVLPRIISPKRHPLRVYALLELGIGIMGVAILFTMPYLDKLYIAHAGSGTSGIFFRGVICAICLLPPTLLMGATLPAIARWVETTPRGVSWLGFFYGGNIIGAVFGCLLAGFYLLRIYDMATTTYVAAAINASVAIVGIFVSTLSEYSVFNKNNDEIESAHLPGAWIVYVVIAISGMSALGAEVTWTRLLSLLLGGTVYTFSIILAVFLFGLGIGSSIGSFISRYTLQPRLMLGFCQLLLTGAIAWTAYMIANSLPYWPIDPYISGSPWYNFQLDILRCIWVILPAACLWGASFPLALASVISPGKDSGRIVGGIYAVNTIGAIIGSICFTLFVIPRFGTQQAQRILIILSAISGMVMLYPVYVDFGKDYCNAIKMSLGKILFSFTGRINRNTFLVVFIPFYISIIIYFVILRVMTEDEKVISTLSPSVEIFLILFFVLYLVIISWIGLAIQFKRWHDRNRSGGMVLINLIPIIGSIWSVVELVFLRGTIGPNRYGGDPLQLLESRSGTTKTTRSCVVGIVSLIVSLIITIVLVWNVSKIPWGLVAQGRFLPTNSVYDDSQSLYMGEGMNASIAISELPSGVKSFHVSGKVVASNDPQDMKLQLMLGHLPALFHPKPRSILVVGCGAGVTAGSFIPHPDVERIVICEIEPLIPKTAAEYFSQENNDVVNDPRVEIVYDDARHYILTTDEKFDIITSDPIHPWVKGAAALYTKEYFNLCKQRLNKGGIVTQWVPLYESNMEAVKSEFATFFDVFPEGTIWGNDYNGEGYDVVLLGYAEAATIDVNELQQRLYSEEYSEVQRSLSTIGFGSALSLLSKYAGRGQDLKSWLNDAVINTDRNLRLQYLAGMGLNLYDEINIYQDMLAHRQFPEDLFIATDDFKLELNREIEKW